MVVLLCGLLGCARSHESTVQDAAPMDGSHIADAGRDASEIDASVLDADARDAALSDASGDGIVAMDGHVEPALDASGCVPDCAGRTCGSDGCGGACGSSCSSGHESFEHYPLRAAYPFDSPETPHTFGSGLILTLPNPNESAEGYAVVTRCESDSGFYGFLCADSARYIPDGLALMVMNRTPDLPFEFAFPTAVRSVRVAATDASGAPDKVLRMDALDVSGAVVASAHVLAGPVSNWRNNWLMVRVASPIIANVRLYGDDPVVLAVDNFYWE